MAPAADRFIELATRPLENNAELQLAAAGELRRRIEAGAASPEALDEAADSLQRADRHPRRHYWRIALYLTTLLVSLPVLGHTICQSLELRRISYMLTSIGTTSTPSQRTPPGVDSARTRLLLFGNENANTEPDRWKPLWESEPENPAFFAQYANAVFRDTGNPSPEILAAAAKIDPDNGWYPALEAAACISDKVVMKKKQMGGSRTEIRTPDWEIKDAAMLKESLMRIHQAAEKKQFDNREQELIRLRIPLLPQRVNFVSQLQSMAYMASQTTAIIHIRKLTSALSAGAQECAANKDIEGFRRIVSDWNILGNRLTANGTTLIDLLVAKMFFFDTAENFRDAADALGLKEETARFSKIHDLKLADREWKNRKGRDDPDGAVITRHGSILAAMTMPMVGRQVKTPPPLTESDLRPGRYADHALFLRAASIAGGLLLGICAGIAAALRFSRGMLCRLQSARIPDLLRFSDWLWILAGGILIPVLWYGFWIHLTPLSSREWSLRFDVFRQAGLQFGSLFLLMLVLTKTLCAARIAKRGAVLGLRARFPWIGWVSTIAAALAVPVSGAILPARFSPGLLEWIAPYLVGLGYALLAIPVIWLLSGIVLNFFGNRDHALRRITLIRMLLPAWIFGMLLMVVSAPFYYAEERHWIQQDRLFEITADAPAMSSYEWDVTQQLRKELSEMMEAAR